MNLSIADAMVFRDLLENKIEQLDEILSTIKERSELVGEPLDENDEYQHDCHRLSYYKKMLSRIQSYILVEMSPSEDPTTQGVTMKYFDNLGNEHKELTVVSRIGLLTEDTVGHYKGWYFFDQMGESHGPFSTFEEAAKLLKRYVFSDEGHAQPFKTTKE